MCVHPMVVQKLPVVGAPLILFSGNRSKKWHCFDVGYLLLGGLSKEEKAHLRNIQTSHVQIELAHLRLQLLLLQIY